MSAQMLSGKVPPLVSTTLFSRLAQLGFRTKLFIGLILVFLALVFAHIHGSSIALSSKFWAPQANHFIAKSLVAELETRLPPEKMKHYRAALQADAKTTRSDEWSVSTMWALAQFNHEPRFPVRNTNIGLGQNMLIVPWVPVAHLSALARPVTWGYMLFGQQVGLAWYWWFSPFFCFATLYLLIEVLLPRDRFLAALGAFWFCASAYNISWSHYPAYLIAFANLTVLGAYALLKARETKHALAAGALLGYGTAGTVMYLYVPWLIPLGYTYAAVLVGLILRDGLLKKVQPRMLGYGLLAAVLVGGPLLGSFVASTMPELRLLANSVYPGVRRLSGGDCSFARLFGGFYNFLTLRKPFLRFPASEWAGFFLFLPTILFAAILSRRVRRRFDAVAWSLMVVGVAVAIYGEVKVPQWLANVTLFSRFQGYRAQVAVGLVSILLSMYVLRRDEAAPRRADENIDGEDPALPSEERRASQIGRLAGLRSWGRAATMAVRRYVRLIRDALAPATRILHRFTRYEALMIGIAIALGATVYLATGTSLHVIAKLYRSKATIPWQIWLVSAGATAASVLLVLGYRRLFATALIPALLLTAGDFNPLSRGFAPLEDSEMWKAIRKVRTADNAAGRDSMWVTSGGPHSPIIGTVASTMGARSMTGVFYHPQLKLWHQLDPERVQERIYNRYSDTHYFPLIPGDPTIRFTLPGPMNFNIRIAPDNPKLRELGVRYALTYDRHTPYEGSEFPRIHISSDGRLRIYQLTD